MFMLNVRDPFGCREVSCVKLPSAVEFPTDGRLLERIEELRRALPANNVKPLWKTREHENRDARSRSGQRPRTVSIEDVTLEGTSCSAGMRVVPLTRADASLAKVRDRLLRAGLRAAT